MEKSMRIVTSAFGNTQTGTFKTFRLIPVSNNCPYVEMIFDSYFNQLVIIGKDKKTSYSMLPKLDANGDVEQTKLPRPNGRRDKEVRQQIETWQEHYVTEKSEQKAIIEMFAINPEFDFQSFLDAKSGYEKAQETKQAEANEQAATFAQAATM